MLLAMTRWHSLESVDATFFATAPVLYRYPVKLAVPPERVWQSLASDRSVADWGLGVRSLTWTSPRPFGVGTTREVVLPMSALRLREEFFRWDEGAGYSFAAVAADRALFTRFAENYEVEPDRTGTLFTWTIALSPVPALARAMTSFAPVTKASFGQLARNAKKYFAANP